MRSSGGLAPAFRLDARAIFGSGGVFGGDAADRRAELRGATASSRFAAAAAPSVVSALVAVDAEIDVIVTRARAAVRAVAAAEGVVADLARGSGAVVDAGPDTAEAAVDGGRAPTMLPSASAEAAEDASVAEAAERSTALLALVLSA